ncbi:MAG: hypothetical protein KatS3mg115_1751 [Candidatus Poribacteria bacterium]|nr:MAG: hypothetical protein KatS3mg115_1751 [Candidatus Poribacteria bacterium]
MRRLPINSYEASEALWERLEERIREASRQLIEPVDELLEREVELYAETSEVWLHEELFDEETPLTVDYMVIGFPEGIRRGLAQYLRGLGLAVAEAPDNRIGHAKLRAYHARAVLFDAGRPSPGAFIQLAHEIQPHLKAVPLGDANNRELFERMRQRGAAAFLPTDTPAEWHARADAFDQCIFAILHRQAAVCPNFQKGRPCRGECAFLEPRPPRPPIRGASIR